MDNDGQDPFFRLWDFDDTEDHLNMSGLVFSTLSTKKQLRRLELSSGWVLRETDLVEFIRDTRVSLRYLTLDLPKLAKGCWMSLLRNITGATHHSSMQLLRIHKPTIIDRISNQQAPYWCTIRINDQDLPAFAHPLDLKFDENLGVELTDQTNSLWAV
ncbi:hypothetical protein BDV96DRAFT_649384 [Lophiotrema nucula]|uniref:F-box domain-containing protein n=1 Tax=Lophiotrema nucula TaxID=690887 RepID=A0A6A5YXV6_9PLEO|nr:hypothetical protein BDV96DRAFT_649384 [Lophiotrema nucula]